MFSFFRRQTAQPQRTDFEKAASLIWCAAQTENLDRDDALMELARFDFEFVQKFLEYFVCLQEEDENLLDTAGGSLWEIWKRKTIFNKDLVEKMNPSAKFHFKAPH